MHDARAILFSQGYRLLSEAPPEDIVWDLPGRYAGQGVQVEFGERQDRVPATHPEFDVGATYAKYYDGGEGAASVRYYRLVKQ